MHLMRHLKESIAKMGLRIHPRATIRKLRRLLSMAYYLSGVSRDDQIILRRGILSALRCVLLAPDIWKYIILEHDALVEAHNTGIFFIRARSDDLRHLYPKTHNSLRKEIDRILRPGAVAIDAGANIGVISVLMSKKIAKDGKLISIEMIPETFQALKKNLNVNACSNVIFKNVAISDSGGQYVEALIPKGKFGHASIITNLLETNVLLRLLELLPWMRCLSIFPRLT